jgi:amino acid transporter
MRNSTTKRKDLGLLELVAIALGGMIGGGIFSILGIATELAGSAASLAIAAGGVLAFLAAYSYAKLSSYYEEEGATYSFFKRTYSSSHFAASAVGWLVVFGYVATLALYAFTFASYLSSLFPNQDAFVLRLLFSAGVLGTFTVLNIVSVKNTGRAEDVLVYSKLVALVVVTLVLFRGGDVSNAWPMFEVDTDISSLFLVASLTFVAFEGFQLAIHAYEEVREPRKNVPRAIYISVAIAAVIYVLMAEGALLAIPHEQLIRDKEYALAGLAFLLVATGGLESILEFGSLTFILVSFLMALANLRIRDKTNSSLPVALAALVGLGGAGALILHYQFTADPLHLVVTISLYVVITLLAWLHARFNPHL